MTGNSGKGFVSLIPVLKILGWSLAAFLLYYHLLPAGLVTLNFMLVLLLPFLLGALLAALLDPVVALLMIRLKFSRGWAVLVTMIVVIGGILAGLTWMVTRIIVELIKLSNSFPDYAKNLTLILENIFNQARGLYFSLDLPPNWQGMLLEQMEGFSVAAVGAINWLISMLAAVPNGILVAFFAFISAYFFSKDKERIKTVGYNVLPPSWGAFLHKIGGETGTAIIGYLRAQLILMLITMGQTLVGLYLLRVEYALIITIFVGLLDLLPVLGPGIIFVPWIAISFLAGKISMAVALVILYGIISVVRQLLQPKILGDNIGIHPLETLISLYIGFKLLGIIGLILGPMILVSLKGTWHYFYQNKGGA